jgi:putative heme-binding domain-containing protein
MQEALSFARAAAAEHDAPKPLRLAAVQLLAHDDPGEAGPVLGALLAPATPVSLQHAALDTITQLRDPEKAVQIIAEAWPVLGPITRIRALGQLIARGECLPPLLDVVAEGTIGIRAFDAGQVALLTQHKDPGLRTRAREIFKDYFAGPHAETVARFRPALQRPASFEHGRTLFMENCSKCHTFNGEGFRVGPDLAFMARAGGDRLLKAILDPNAEVNPLYFSYTIETGDFQTITGIIAAEDDASLLVRGPSGEENVISRDNIDTMSTFNQSLMPEGWDSAFGEQGIADLIAYLSLAAIRGR